MCAELVEARPSTGSGHIPARQHQLEELGDEGRGSRGTVGLDRSIVNRPPDFFGDHVGDQLGGGCIEVEHPSGAVLVEPVTDVEVLLEVVPQRYIDKRPAALQ